MARAVNQLSYEAWILRRGAGGLLDVTCAAVASGPAEVLVPLPWSDVRLAATGEGEREAPGWAAVGQLFSTVLPWWQRSLGLSPGAMVQGTPGGPPGDRRARGEPCAGIVRRDALRAGASLPDTWAPASHFLRWPALSGWSAQLSRIRRRTLEPVHFVVNGGGIPMVGGDVPATTLPSLTVYTTAADADLFVLARERLEDLPAGWTTDLFHGTEVVVPGLVDSGDHVHWRRHHAVAPHLHRFDFQLFREAWRGRSEAMIPRTSWHPRSADEPPVPPPAPPVPRR